MLPLEPLPRLRRKPTNATSATDNQQLWARLQIGKQRQARWGEIREVAHGEWVYIGREEQDCSLNAQTVRTEPRARVTLNEREPNLAVFVNVREGIETVAGGRRVAFGVVATTSQPGRSDRAIRPRPHQRPSSHSQRTRRAGSPKHRRLIVRSRLIGS